MLFYYFSVSNNSSFNTIKSILKTSTIFRLLFNRNSVDPDFNIVELLSEDDNDYKRGKKHLSIIINNFVKGFFFTYQFHYLYT